MTEEPPKTTHESIKDIVKLKISDSVKSHNDLKKNFTEIPISYYIGKYFILYDSGYHNNVTGIKITDVQYSSLFDEKVLLYEIIPDKILGQIQSQRILKLENTFSSEQAVLERLAILLKSDITTTGTYHLTHTGLLYSTLVLLQYLGRDIDHIYEKRMNRLDIILKSYYEADLPKDLFVKDCFNLIMNLADDNFSKIVNRLSDMKYTRLVEIKDTDYTMLLDKCFTMFISSVITEYSNYFDRPLRELLSLYMLSISNFRK